MSNSKRKQPLEPLPSMPYTRGYCDYCGDRCRLTYCNDRCKVKYNNIGLVHGKSLIQLLKIWRIHRGRKGTPGEGKYDLIMFRLDGLIADDRQRRKDMTAEREAAK